MHMKKLIKRLATYVVTAYAQHLYKRIVKKAEERHEQEKTMIYVVSALNDVSRLCLYNRKQFRAMKAACKIYDPNYGVKEMRDGAWYHTGDALGKRRLSAVDQEARRLIFIQHILKRSNLF